MELRIRPCCDWRWARAVIAVLVPLSASHAVAQNETCETASVIVPGQTFFATFGATSDGPSNCGFLGSDIWYAFTADVEGIAVISTCGQTSMDTVLNVYDACNGTSIVCLDDSCGTETEISFPILPGQDYFLQLGGFNGEQGNGSFTLTYRADGGCCVAGVCTLTSEAACAAAGGIYRGDGVDCAAAACDQLGACCLPASQGLCQIMLAADCQAAGGTFSGPGTACEGSAPFTGFAVDFDGSNDTIQVQHTPAIAFALGQGITIEAWVQMDVLNAHIFTKDSDEFANYALRVNGAGGLDFFFKDASNSFWSQYSTGNGLVTTNTWIHIAVAHTFGDPFSTQAYINGLPVAGNWVSGDASQGPIDNGGPLWIGGTPLSPGGNIVRVPNGRIDEARVWNIRRADFEVAQDFGVSLTGSEPNLAGYWRLDEGSGTTVSDSAGKADGMLVNGPEWVATQQCGSAPLGACCLVSGACIRVSESGCAGVNGVYSGDGTACGAVSCSQPGACCVSPDNGTCLTLPEPQCAAIGGSFRGAGSSCDGVAPFSGAALDYDGVDDTLQVTHTSDIAFGLGQGITLEAWVYLSSFDAHIMTKDSDDLANYALRVNGGGGIDFFFKDATNSFWSQYSSNVGPVTPNRWYHIAVAHTFGDPASTRTYANGQHFAGNWVSGDATQGPIDGGGPLWIGGTPLAPGGNIVRVPNGLVDEARVWNVQRTDAQIAQTYATRLTGNEAGLAGYWPMDEGSGTTVADLAGSADGTLVNGTLWAETRTCCACDWNADAILNSQDFFDFLTAFFAGSADYNNNGLTDSQDFFDFLTCFFEGC